MSLFKGKANLNRRASFGADARGRAGVHKLDLSVVQRLVLGGANVNQRSHEGWTPLLIACYSGHDLVADYLIGRSADTVAVIRGRKICMEWASSKGHAKCVEALQASIERAKLL